VERTVVFVDAENVRRSTWPNVAPDRLLELCRAWAETSGVHAVVVFDGRAPGGVVGEHTVDEGCTAVGTGPETADDWIIRATASAGRYRLVTSDRGLRAAAGARAERVVGGGRFVRSLIG
jgi:predicted RNA-binding protein with PIN domain